MNKFLWIGIIRDKSRSLLPIIVVAIGVMAVVLADGFVAGTMNNMVDNTAIHQTGHLKVVTNEYAKYQQQAPIDLALLDVEVIVKQLQGNFPELNWHPRIIFAGLIDIPDNMGNTSAQGPVTATAYDLLSADNNETSRLTLQQAIVNGNLIQHTNEILLSADFAEKFKVQPNDTVTFFGNTMDGSMCFMNLKVAGIVRFGMTALDKGAIIMDITGARMLLDMDDAASEIFGFFKDNQYSQLRAENVKNEFNQTIAGMTPYDPIMIQLADQNDMKTMLALTDYFMHIMVALLVLALSIVLWNAGLLGCIRRYNEFGVRLAMGEEKKHLYQSILVEALFIGSIGACIGTTIGVAARVYFHHHGIDYGQAIDSLGMMVNSVVTTDVSNKMFVVGLLPGIIATTVGAALAGISVYKRNTATLFKELE